MRTERYILLNMEREARASFVEGAPQIPAIQFRTKKMFLHISPKGEIAFLIKNRRIKWRGAHVVTRHTLSDEHFCGMLYQYFAHTGIPANDPINLSHPYSDEKISQMLTLALAGIRIPESFIFREESFAKNEAYIRKHLTFPAMYKTDGGKGQQVQYVETFEALQLLVAQKQPSVLALVQPFISNTYDIGVIATYGEILGAIKRTRTEGHLNNISQGAQASAYTLTEEEAQLALRAAEVCGIDIAGVDIMHTPTGPVILEVNKTPQVTGFESVHNFKVFTKIAEMFRAKEVL